MRSFLFIVLFAGWIAASSVQAATTDTPSANSEPIVMSPFETMANSVGFERWVKLESPHYVLYTDAGEREGTTVLRQSEMLQQATQVYFRRMALDLPKVVLVLPTSHSDWATIAAKGAVQWQIAAAAGAIEVRPLILSSPAWDEDGLGAVHGIEGLINVERLNFKGPLWFGQGIMDFFETAEFDDKAIILGRANRRMLNLRGGGWLPWDRFFRITDSSPEFREERRVQQYAAQCAMFVQYLLTNTDSTQIVRFVTWDALLGAGREPSETDFKAIFGQDWKQWQHTMEVFTMHGEYRMSSIKMPPEVAKAAVKRLELPVREMRELFVLTRILHQRVPESSASLDALLARGLKTENLREFLLAACIEHDRPQAALAQARRLMEAGSSNAEVYAQAARLRFNREVKRVRLDSRLSAEAVADIRKWCGQALRLEPRLAEANDLLALTLAIQPTVTPADAEAVRAIYRLQNGLVSTCPTAVALMIARQRSGDPERARQIAEILSASPYADEQSRHLAKSLIARADKN